MIVLVNLRMSKPHLHLLSFFLVLETWLFPMQEYAKHYVPIILNVSNVPNVRNVGISNYG